MSSIRYDPVGYCIYCGNHSIGDEHIIPRAIGGTLVLPNASCRPCERTIGLFENRCARYMFGVAKAHLGIRSRKANRSMKYIHTDVRGQPIKISVDEHPGEICSFVFWPPKILLGQDCDDKCRTIEGHILIWPTTKDAQERQKRLNKPITIARNLSALDLARQIAKIAHSYAIAEIRRRAIEQFKPFLVPLILGKEPIFPSYLIGGSLDEFPPLGKGKPATPARHEIDMNIERHISSQARLVVVKIRLFSAFDETPTYFAVAGEIA